MYTLGIDIGSASSKAVILKDGTDVVASAVVQVGTGTSGPGRVLEEVFSNVDLTQEDMDYTVATGYGRFSVENADKQLSEITCHAKGIFHLVPSARTIIDIGGQDAKAIQLDNKGNILKFVMNDKCADADGKVPKSHITKAGEFRFSCFKRVESVRYMMKKQQPFFCQRNTTGGTFEEVCLKFVFKTADGFADGRLTNVEPSGSSGDGAALGNGIKNAV